MIDRETEIAFNIWDDYDEDEGDTIGIIEDDTPDEEKREIVLLVEKYIVENLALGEATVEAGDVDLDFEHLSHDRREQLVEELEQSGLTYNGKKIVFYSES